MGERPVAYSRNGCRTPAITRASMGHRAQDAVAQHEMMKQGCAGMQAGDPEDRIGEPGMKAENGMSERCRSGEGRGNATEQIERQRMAFEPTAGDRRQRYDEEQPEQDPMDQT